jgi:hypothetical protein
MSRTIRVLRLGVLIVSALATWATVTFAQPDCPGPLWPPPNAYIYGQEGWWDTDDVIQFVGDANTSSLESGGCSGHDSMWNTCHIDFGFNFREVYDFDETECTYTAGDICNVVKVRCCFWFPGVCGTCSSCCDPHDLCKSFWKVVAFSEDGNTGRGCWELEFISDCTEEDCEDGLDMCNTVLKWFD